MIDEYRFFQDFFDGQIVKKESDNYKLYKILLTSLFSVIGLFFVLMGWCGIVTFILLELGMIWNFYVGLGNKISYVLCIAVAFLYFYVATQYAIYVNALIYIACYIPLQLIATGKDYSEGDFVQIRKKITDFNKILFIVFYVLLFVFLYMLDYNFGSRFILLDVLSASLLVCSALLRNERYLEYYIFRVFALASSIVLWIMVAFEYSATECSVIVLMYVAYLIYDVVEYIVHSKTYVNEMMLQVEDFKKKEDKELVDLKLKEFEKLEDEEKIAGKKDDEPIRKMIVKPKAKKTNSSKTKPQSTAKAQTSKTKK